MERIVVARVSRPHGLAGALVLDLETGTPAEIFVPGRSLQVRAARAGLPDRLTVREARPHGRGWLLRVEEVADRSFAEQYAGSYLTVTREELPELAEDEFFLHQLIGLHVVDEEAGALGEVTDVYDVPAGALLGVRAAGGERLIPFRREVVRRVALEEGRLEVRLPAGLLDL